MKPNSLEERAYQLYLSRHDQTEGELKGNAHLLFQPLVQTDSVLYVKVLSEPTIKSGGRGSIPAEVKQASTKLS